MMANYLVAGLLSRRHSASFDSDMATPDQIDLARASPFRLGPITVEPALRQVTAARSETLEPRVMQVFVVLAMANGGLVSRDDLVRQCWEGRIVGDDSINRVIARLRKLADEHGVGAFRIETITKVGYRLIGQVVLTAPSVRAPLATDIIEAPIPPMQAQAGALQSAPNRRLLIGGAAAVAALVAGGIGAWKLMDAKADDGTASVVVLPFANLSSDPEQAFLSDGIAEELRNALSQISGLKVIGRITSEQFRDSKDLSAIAEKLGVDHVLTGSVRRSPTTIRIGAQLVDGRTGVERWSQSYDQPVGDALAIQSKIANSVVAALSAKLGKVVGTIVVGGTSNPAAQTLFLKALKILVGTMSDSAQQQGLALIDSAIALDPAYAEAWALKAHVTSNLIHARSVGEMSSEALAAAQRAVALAPGSGFVRLALARQYSDRLEMRRAFAETERGLPLAPSDAGVLNDAARTLQPLDPDRGLTLANAAVALDPLNMLWKLSLARLLLDARRFSEVAAPLENAASIGARQTALFLRAKASLWSGQTAGARELVNGMEPGRGKLGLTAILEARAGNRAESDRALVQFRAVDSELKYSWSAAIHAQRGETALALDAVEAALRAKEVAIVVIAQEVAYDPIREEPRFKAVQDAVIPPDLFVRPKRR